MKKLYALIFISCLLNSAKAQMVFLADTNWRNFLINEGYSTCIINDSLNGSCPLLAIPASLICENKNLTDITGVEYFINLQQLHCGTNHLTFLPLLPPTLTSLDCYFNNLTSIDTLPATLKALSCSRNQITTLDHYLPPGLETLTCNYNPITAINQSLDSLKRLEASSTNISDWSSLPLPSTLQYLNVSNNNISTSPSSLPVGLTSLICFGNNIPALNNLPDSLVILYCSDNPSISIPSLPSKLRDFYCDQNDLTSLPVLPSTLILLSANSNQLSNIDSFPAGMDKISLDYNLLNNLPPLPAGLRQLTFEHNQFTTLPVLPNSLTLLKFGNNSISSVPTVLPSNLIGLHCDSNQINSLPDMPGYLNYLDARNNLLTSMGTIPDSLIMINVSWNPISCLPIISNTYYLGISNTNIGCLPQRITFQSADLDPDTLPLCGISSGCPINWNVQGHVIHDTNSNCSQDINENSLFGIPVYLDSSNITLQTCYTTAQGEYSFKATPGNYNVRIDSMQVPFNINCPAIGTYTFTLPLSTSFIDTLDYSLSCKLEVDLAAQAITPLTSFRPGINTPIFLKAGDLVSNYRSVCFNQAGTVQAILSPLTTFAGPAFNALAPSTINGDTLTWNIADFSLITPDRDFNIEVTTITSATIGDTAFFQLSISPFADYDVTNNSIVESFPVVAAFDPNEKWMEPMFPDTADHEFTFTVLFQNTGTAPARNIFILDSIDNDLDPSTFELISSSHEVITQILPGNILRFNYNFIELPDSNSNEPASHGFVKYKLTRKSNTGIGTEISNTAYIYFDYNSAIVTNTVSGTIQIDVGQSDINPNNSSIIIYPNPVSDQLNIRTSSTSLKTISVINIYGKEIMFLDNVNSSTVKLDLGNLTNGIYIINITDAKGNKSVRRLIKNN